jgi:hypothetical protein
MELSSAIHPTRMMLMSVYQGREQFDAFFECLQRAPVFLSASNLGILIRYDDDDFNDNDAYMKESVAMLIDECFNWAHRNLESEQYHKFFLIVDFCDHFHPINSDCCKNIILMTLENILPSLEKVRN